MIQLRWLTDETLSDAALRLLIWLDTIPPHRRSDVSTVYAGDLFERHPLRIERLIAELVDHNLIAATRCAELPPTDDDPRDVRYSVVVNSSSWRTGGTHSGCAQAVTNLGTSTRLSTVVHNPPPDDSESVDEGVETVDNIARNNPRTCRCFAPCPQHPHPLLLPLSE